MIPVFEPIIGQEEIEAVVEVLKRGEISGSFGNTIPQFEAEFAQFVECDYGVAVSSGTTALQLAVAALDITRGDDVLISTSTNIATALAVYHNGARIIPIDSEPDTWNMDLSLIERYITPATKAIIPVHLFGHPVQMEQLMEIANHYKIAVVEDCAEAHGAEINGRKAGSFGLMNCFSFYANKIITTGEGGMITSSDKKLVEKLRLLRNLAFTTPRFLHEYPGYNFRMTGMQAGLGLAQVHKIESFIRQKRLIAKIYNSHLKNVPFLQLPIEKAWAKNVYWMYGVVVKSDRGVTRDALMSYLHKNGIDTRTFFCPMGKQTFLKNYAVQTDTPVADSLWERGFYLPSSCSLDEEKIKYICDCISKFPQS